MAKANSISVTVYPQKWIPCSERFPEDNGAYLVTIQTNNSSLDHIYGFYIEVRIRDSRGWMSEENIVAWMPLPEPYRGEE